MRILMLVVALLGTVSCSGGERALPANPTSPSPPSGTLTLSGTTSETAPTTTTAIGGAKVSVSHGPNAGRTVTSDGNGAFTLGALEAGIFAVRVEAANYVTHSQEITLTADQRVAFALDPVFQLITVSREGSIEGAAGCPGYWDYNYGRAISPINAIEPCTAEYVLDVHHSGNIDAQLSWSDRDVFFWMELYRMAEGAPSYKAEESKGSGSPQRLDAALSGHQQYLIRVRVVDSGGGPAPSRAMPFTLTVTRPN